VVKLNFTVVKIPVFLLKMLKTTEEALKGLLQGD
jgi:hypothetical protein